MKRQERIEHYSFARAEWIDKLRQSTESWDYGRKHALPIWPEFVSKGYFHETMFYAHHRPTNTAFELPLTGELLVEHGDRKITVHPGELYILPAGEPNTLRAGNAITLRGNPVIRSFFPAPRLAKKRRRGYFS